MLGMTEKLAQPTLDLPTAFDAWYLPRRPLCCDADYAQLRRRSRADALKHEHIETNPAALVNMLVVDIDAAEGRAMALWEHQGMMPNLVMENPANGQHPRGVGAGRAGLPHGRGAAQAPEARQERHRGPQALLRRRRGLRRPFDEKPAQRGVEQRNHGT